MKNLIAFIFFVCATQTYAQKYLCKSGTTSFVASVETFEPVEATNKSTTVLLDCTTGKLAALLFVNAFHFEIALMQEHFNENYMDTEQYPKATFNGEILDFNLSKLTTEPTVFNLKGILTIKEVSKPVETTVQIVQQNNTILLTGAFSITPEEYAIKIPKIVRKKIADKTQLTFNYALQPKE